MYGRAAPRQAGRTRGSALRRAISRGSSMTPGLNGPVAGVWRASQPADAEPKRGVTLRVPLESDRLYVLTDARTGAHYSECHIKASALIDKATVDAPLDPDEQPDYRANRELVEDHVAYQRMCEDALAHRTFSNIVAEYSTT